MPMLSIWCATYGSAIVSVHIYTVLKAALRKADQLSQK